MKTYKADLHVHTVLSPCGALEMSPKNIVQKALEEHMDILAITDHNSTRQAELIYELAARVGIKVYFGAEVNTSEEIHCLTFFESIDHINQFQEFLDEHLPEIMNNPETIGHQVVVNEKEEIVYEEPKLLIAGLNADVSTVQKKVHELNGLFIPAHIDRPSNSLISQLGFLPADLNIDGIELSGAADVDKFQLTHSWTRSFPVIRGSDAHHPQQIGQGYTWLTMESTDFKEFEKTLRGIGERKMAVA